MVSATSSISVLLAFEVAETLSYVLAGAGILLVSMKARTISDEAAQAE